MKRFLSFLLAIVLTCTLFSLPAFAEKDAIYDLSLDARGVYIVNTETDTPIYEKQQDTRMYPASTTKIMTALVVLELCQDPKNETITCPDTEMFRYIINDGGVNMQLSRGEVLSVYDVTLGMIMNSFCDAADLLAWHFGNGDVNAFIQKMNNKAKELGLENTHFTNAHGLHDAEHYSSPKDIATFFREALKHPLFVEMISTRDYTIPANNRHKARKLQYTVSIYYEDNPWYSDAFVGGKSGFTDQAGRCLATYSQKDGVSYISVLLGSNMDTSRNYPGYMAWIETHTLISYAYQHYQVKTVLEKGAQVALLPVMDSETKLSVTAAETFRILVRNEVEPSYRLQLPEQVVATEISPQQQIGTAVLLLDENETETSYPLLLNWDGTPIQVESALEKEIGEATDSIKGIFENDKIFVFLLILLLLVIGISLPALKISRTLHEKNSHIPKH